MKLTPLGRKAPLSDSMARMWCGTSAASVSSPVPSTESTAAGSSERRPGQSLSGSISMNVKRSSYVPAGVSPLCGNSVHQDRRFMVRYLPQLEAYFLYRNLDVSTLKELARRWKPEIMLGLTKHGKHEALADIHESIDELKYYREHFLKL